MSKPNGYVLWQGTSLLDGKPIVVIATGFASGSENRKTGAMIQTWILRADVEPHIAIKTGDDESICGQCPHRGTTLGDSNKGRACYVLVHNAPLAVYRAWKRHVYPDFWDDEIQEIYKDRRDWLEDLGRNRRLRLGSYGDPAAVPTWVWAALTTRADGWTGYTHQWKENGIDPQLQEWCMASCDSPEDLTEARDAGWRAFYVVPQGTPIASDVTLARASNLVICPASEERDKRTTCDKCGLCQGTAVKTKLDIVIAAHGAGAKKIG